jgi:hypothetical protein
MIPSVTNGAIIVSAASKKHEKLPRGSSATMIVFARNHREQHRHLPKLLTDDRENGANIPWRFRSVCREGQVVQRKHTYTARQPQ